MSYSYDVFRKDIIKELNRIATALENIDMKMNGENSFKPEVASYIEDEKPKMRTLTDCVGCEFLCSTVDPCLNEKRYICSHYSEYINKISDCRMR